MDIKALVKEAHRTAIDKGFWEVKKCNYDLPTLKGYALVERNTSELLMLVVTELAEACEALRKDFRQTDTITREYGEGLYEDIKVEKKDWVWKKDTFEDEIADAFIRLADLCGAMDIDIEWQIRKKMDYNKTRERKHGKAF
jgi:NTP pyrophosphatase (non-canonical NTP hydrolase)